MTVVQTYRQPPSCIALDPQNLRYVPDRRIRTVSASRAALSVVQWIRSGVGLDTEPDEKMLFVALQTCAYRTSRRNGRTRIPEQERAAWADRWQIIRTYLVEKNFGLAYSLVNRFRARHTHEDDLLSDALYTLMQAVERFNPWKGFRFSTYAWNAIARKLMHCERRESRYRQLFPVHREPTLDRTECAPDAETELRIERMNRVLEQNLGELTDLESRIIVLRFLMPQKVRPGLREIGGIVGLSQERVRQIQNIALSKLRDALDQDPLLK